MAKVAESANEMVNDSPEAEVELLEAEVSTEMDIDPESLMSEDALKATVDPEIVAEMEEMELPADRRRREREAEENKHQTDRFDAVRIAVASPDEILSWSFGEVLKPETIN